jgi:hypothetical protein
VVLDPAAPPHARFRMLSLGALTRAAVSGFVGPGLLRGRSVSDLVLAVSAGATLSRKELSGRDMPRVSVETRPLSLLAEVLSGIGSWQNPSEEAIKRRSPGIHVATKTECEVMSFAFRDLAVS